MGGDGVCQGAAGDIQVRNEISRIFNEELFFLIFFSLLIGDSPALGSVQVGLGGVRSVFLSQLVGNFEKKSMVN